MENCVGCIRDQEWLSTIKIPVLQDIINQSIYINTKSKRLEFIREMPSPKYNKIELARRTVYDVNGKMKESRLVFIKRPIKRNKSLLYEACMQHIAYKLLSDTGDNNVSKVYDIFKLSDGTICFSMEILMDAKPMDRYLEENITNTELTGFIIEILMQICSISSILSKKIGLNHRDLRPSNIMIKKRNIQRNIMICVPGNEPVQIISSYVVSYIDFGFSCIGNIETGMMDLQLGHVFSDNDPCPKDGRDMFMFLCFLYIQLWSKIKRGGCEDVHILFEKWLENNITGILNKLERLGGDFDKWIYFISGNEKIKNFHCTPSIIFEDLLRI